MDKILLILCGVLLIGLGVMGWLLKHSYQKNAQNELLVKQSQVTIHAYQVQSDMQNYLQKKGNQISLKISSKNLDNLHFKTIEIQNVEHISDEVKQNKISEHDADVAYIGSMWSTYCKVRPTDKECSTRSAK